MTEKDKVQYIEVLLALSGHGSFDREKADKKAVCKNDLSTFVHKDEEDAGKWIVIASC